MRSLPAAFRIGRLCLLLASLQAPVAFAAPAYLQGNNITTYASAASTDGKLQLYVYCNRLGKLDTYVEVAVKPDSYLSVAQQFDKGPKEEVSYIPEMNGSIMFLAQNKRSAFIEQVKKSSKLTMTLETQTYTVPLDALNRTLKGFVCKLGG